MTSIDLPMEPSLYTFVKVLVGGFSCDNLGVCCNKPLSSKPPDKPMLEFKGKSEARVHAGPLSELVTANASLPTFLEFDPVLGIAKDGMSILTPKRR